MMTFFIHSMSSMISCSILFTVITSMISLSEPLKLHDSYKCYVFCLASCYNETKDFRFCEMNCHMNTYPTNTCIGTSSNASHKDHELQIPEWNDTVVTTNKNSSSSSPSDSPLNPRLIELQWYPVDKALIYALMWREFMANDTPPQFQLYETPSNRLTFVKQLICAEHEFRVAAVNDKQFGNFSEILHINKPLPPLDNFNLRVTNMELLLNKEKTIVQQRGTLDRSANYDEVNLTLTYDWPLNWNESAGDIEKMGIQSVVAQSPRDCRCTLYKANSPKRMDNENATTSVDYLIYTNLTGCTCNIWFKINSIVSRCGDKLKVGEGSTNVDFAEIHCKNVQNAKCNNQNYDENNNKFNSDYHTSVSTTTTMSASAATSKMSSASVTTTKMSASISSKIPVLSSIVPTESSAKMSDLSVTTSRSSAKMPESFATKSGSSASAVPTSSSPTTSVSAKLVESPDQCKIEEFKSQFDQSTNELRVSWLINKTVSDSAERKGDDPDAATDLDRKDHQRIIYYVYRMTSLNLNTSQAETIVEHQEISINLTKDSNYAEMIIPMNGTISNDSLYYMQICQLPEQVHLIDWSIVIKNLVYYSPAVVDYYTRTVAGNQDFENFVKVTATTAYVLKKARSMQYLMIYLGIGVLSCILLNFFMILYTRNLRRRRQNLATAKPLRSNITKNASSSSSNKVKFDDADETMMANQNGKRSSSSGDGECKNDYILNTFSKL